MRELFLPPDHSQWWLLSPGIMLYYDKISILRSDFEDIVSKGSMSSYHSAISKRIPDLINCKEDNFELIDTCDVLDKYNKNNKRSLREEAKNIRGELIQRALDPSHTQITKHTVFFLLESSFRAWMEFNERKLSFLNKSEPLYMYLYENTKNYRTWVKRGKQLQYWMENAEALSDEDFKRICQDEIGGALLRLIETSLRYIILIQSGVRIYDPLMYSYQPTIWMLESGNFSDYINAENNAVYNAFSLLVPCAARHKYFIPKNLKGDDLKRAIDKYEIIRKN